VGPCDSVVVPRHFGVGWKTLNHRISRLEARLAEVTDCSAAAARISLRGGGFANGKFFHDDASASFAAQRVRSEHVRAAKFTVAGAFEGGLAEGAVRVSRADLGLGESGSLVALVGGLKFHTDVPQPPEFEATNYPQQMGFTLRGIGAGARVVAEEDDADEITVHYRLQFQPGAAPDRARHNRAIAHARIGAELDVIVLDVSDVPVRTLEHSYAVSYVRPGIGNMEQPPPDKEKIARRATGAPGDPRGFVGIGDFRFDMKFGRTCASDEECPDGACVKAVGRCAGRFGLAGDYLQSVTVSTGFREWNPETGEAVFDVLGHVSNSSDGIAFRPLDYDFSNRFVWIQTDDVYPLGPVEGPLEKGTVRLAFSE
jgi:hypothetical protein